MWIDVIGARMVGCDAACLGASTPAQGTPPRCLWQETPADAAAGDGPGPAGVIVIGLNPGHAEPQEIAFYQQHGLSYPATVAYLQANAPAIRYFRELKRLVHAMFNGLPHTIHWTEIAKCELLPGHKQVPLAMRRTCIERHLKAELQQLAGWPVIAAGRIAFETMATLCTDRPVIGVAHPTGAYGGQFAKLFTVHGALMPPVQARVADALNKATAEWL